MDFDRRGKEGTARLKQNLERAKIKVNTSFWRDLLELAGREIQSIESFTAYLLTLQEKTA